MIERFVARRAIAWRRLEELITRAGGKGIGALSAEQIVELGSLYRQTAGDLAVARRDFPHDRAVVYLNQLLARAHGIVYRMEPGNWRQAGSFFRRGFPQLFRATLPFTLAAFLIFALAGLAGYLVVLLSPDSATYLVPAQVIASVKEQRLWTDEVAIPPQLMATAIMQNNIQVAFFAFSGGVLFGTASFYVLASNGLAIGAVGGLCQAYGLALGLWSFVAPHGFIELTVIFIAGGAGLQLGHALLLPGLLRRRHALLVAASRAMRLLLGCVPLLVVAGSIEGFGSPSHLPPALKLLAGAATAILLYAYLLLAGRGPVQPERRPVP